MQSLLHSSGGWLAARPRRDCLQRRELGYSVTASTRRLQRHGRLQIAAAFGRGRQTHQAVQPQTPGGWQLPQVPRIAVVPMAGLVLAWAVWRLQKALRGRGSLTSAQDRGLMKQEKGVASEGYYTDVMKRVNTISMEELSPAQIEAARKRRSKERESVNLDLEQMELPDNHPFAIKKKISKDEEELIKKRLEVKRGLPLQDLSGRRGLPDDPRRVMQSSAEQQALEAMLDAQAAKAREARFARQAAERQRQLDQQNKQ